MARLPLLAATVRRLMARPNVASALVSLWMYDRAPSEGRSHTPPALHGKRRASQPRRVF
jgi:hypothetical protein